MGDVVKEVKKVGSAVGNAANNAVSAVSNGVNNVATQTTGVANAVRENFERSDVGRVTSSITRPVTTVFEGAKDIGRGVVTGQIEEGFSRAGRRAVGTIAETFNPVAQVSNASRSVENALDSNDFTNSFSQSGRAFKTLQRGESLSQAEVNSITNMTVKQAAIAGVVVGAPAGYAAAKGALVKATAGGVVTGGAAVVSAIKDPKGAVVNALNNVVPGAGDAAGRVIDGVVNPGSGTREPATTTTPAVQTAPSGSGIDTNTMLIAGGAGFLGLMGLLIAKRR